MKKYLLFLLLFPGTLLAQDDWAPVGAKWWYGSHDIPLFGPPPYAVWFDIMYSASADTILGKPVRKIEYPILSCTFFENSPYIYSDSNRVYYYSEGANQFFLLYDMNLNPGESWTIYYLADSIQVTVVDTSSVAINGVVLKKQQIEVSPSGPYSYWGYEIIEKIGNTYCFFPLNTGMCDYGFDYLRCYEDSVNGIYAHFEDCEYTDVGIAKTSLQERAEVSPNPVADMLSINLPERMPGTELSILNLNGQVVYSSSIPGLRTQIPMGDFADGVYLLKLQNAGQSAGFKIVVQH